MSALLAEPFTLASYPTPSQKYPQSGEPGHSKRRRHVAATCSSSSHGNGLVTVSVQGDGIHVLELSNMHASVSHTLGPSAFFTAAAVTRFDSPEASTSYAVMESAADGIAPHERGRTVWWWKDRQSRRPEEPAEPKRSSVFPRRVEHIWAPSSLLSRVIAVSPSGEVMLADENLTITSSSELPNVKGTLVKAWAFEPAECAFLEHQSGGMVVMCFVVVDKRMKLRVTLAQTTGTLSEIVECDLGVQEGVMDISCDVSGYISILTRRGEWQFFRLSHDPAAHITAKPFGESLRLAGISFPSGKGNLAAYGPSVTSVGSSHVLLAGIVGGSSPEVALLLWDLQYSVVLASQTVALPSTLAYTPKSHPSLELVPASRTQALLVLSPAVSTGAQRDAKSVQTRSTVLVVPLDVPPVSTIALAMGKARDTKKWLQSTHKPSASENLDENRQRMIKSVRRALEQGQSQAAESAFFSWVKEETARLKHFKKTTSAKETEVDSDEGADPDTEQKASSKRKWKNKGPTKPVLSHHFVSTVLNMALQPSKPSDAPYASKIVLYLVDRKAVGHAMVEGGLIPALASRRDWESVTSTLRNVLDVPEADIITILAEVAASYRQGREVQDDGMQVDTPADVPQLPQYLAAVVGYGTSPPALRVALKQHLTDTRDVMCVLEVLEHWVNRWCEKNMGLTPSLGASSTEAPGISSTEALEVRPRSGIKKTRSTDHGGMPPFEQIILFLQCLLDTHFLSLLQYSPSHIVMERLAQQLRQQVVVVDDLDRIRGPVESFVRIETEKARSRKAKKENEGDWRKKRKEFQAAELAIGPYQIEELAI